MMPSENRFTLFGIMLVGILLPRSRNFAAAHEA
jgi:hypothetical protein